MPQKRTLTTVVGLISLAALIGTGILALITTDETQIIQPTQEQLAEIIKPAVVRIVEHVTGEYSVPEVDFNLQDLTVSVRRDKPKITKVDEYYAGSGFVVNPNGYILTNAHVVSPEMVKRVKIEELLNELIQTKTVSLTDQQINDYFKDAQTAAEFQQRVYDALNQNTTFTIQSKIAVLNPSSDLENVTRLFETGFPAEVLSVHGNFLEDEKDLAIIKIDAQNLPSVPLGNSQDLAPGQQIYVFGFPATAEFNRRTPLESTFTQGIISALKFSDSKDFKIFQTDAKVSQGSSGGPLFNDRGEVVGIVTFETGELEQDSGDNFAFAIPIALAEQTLKEKNIPNEPGEYEQHFKKGLAYFQSNQCRKATEEFTEAAKVNKNFTADKYVNPYLENCQKTIAAGKSVDSGFGLVKVRLHQVTSFVWFVVVGRFVLVLLGLWIVWKLIQRIRKDESEISELSVSLEQEKDLAMQLIEELKRRGVVLPTADEETHSQSRKDLGLPHPHVAEYVKEARAVGLHDEHISAELKKGGWEDHEIHSALKTSP